MIVLCDPNATQHVFDLFFRLHDFYAKSNYIVLKVDDVFVKKDE